MIHIVTIQNRRLYQSHLWAAQAKRPAEGVHRTGWLDLTTDGQAELDEAIDLLGFDDQMDLELGLRLVPTDVRDGPGPGLAPLLASAEPSRPGADVWSVARLFTTDVWLARTEADRNARLLELWTAALGLALASRVTRVVGLIDMTLHPGPLQAPIGLRLVGPPRSQPDGVTADAEIVPSNALLERLRAAIGVESAAGYHVDELDLRAFGDLAGVQRQVIRAQIPQAAPGSARDEVLAAETLFRVNSAYGKAWRSDGDDCSFPLRELNA